MNSPEPLEWTELSPDPEQAPVPQVQEEVSVSELALASEQVPGLEQASVPVLVGQEQVPMLEQVAQEALRKRVNDACPDIWCDHLRISSCQVTLEARGHKPIFHSARKSWMLNYPVLSFMMNGQLFSEYARVTGMLGSHIHSSTYSNC